MIESFKQKFRRGTKAARDHMDALAAIYHADGCSSAPDFWWTKCCNEHDVYYRSGKDEDETPITRAEADKRLRRCLARTAKTPVGKWLLSWLYWSAVRVFGSRYWGKHDKSPS